MFEALVLNSSSPSVIFPSLIPSRRPSALHDEHRHRRKTSIDHHQSSTLYARWSIIICSSSRHASSRLSTRLLQPSLSTL